MLPELADVEFEDVSVAGVEEEFEVSGEAWPDCVDCAPLAPAGEPVVPPALVAFVSAVVDDGEFVASPEVAGAVVDESACCDGLAGAAVLPAPARVFMRLGR